LSRAKTKAKLNQLNHPEPEKVRIVYRVSLEGKGPHSKSRMNIITTRTVKPTQLALAYSS